MLKSSCYKEIFVPVNPLRPSSKALFVSTKDKNRHVCRTESSSMHEEYTL